jgi:DNA-binding NtrC family response regulator
VVPELEENARILVVDDDAVVCRNLKRILADEGYRVETRQSGRLALEAMDEGSWDVMVLDLRMPEMDGMEVLKAVKESHPATEVIMITGYSSIASAVEAMKLGAFDFIPKPFTSERLIIVVSKAIERATMRLENMELHRKLEEKIQELRDAEDQLIRSEKLVSLGKMAAGMAHDINNPLATILNCCHLLLKRLQEDEKSQKDLERMIGEITHCSNIVKGMMERAGDSP